MKDLTQGPVSRHLVSLSVFIAVSMLFQTLYLLADVYWAGRLGQEAVAALSLSGNLMFIVFALTQTLSVGTTTMISQAVGAGDQPRAQLVFNQAMALSLGVGLLFSILAFATRTAYCEWLSADHTTALLGEQYLRWFIPALLLQFAIVAMAAGLRGTGIVKPTMITQVLTVILNIVLAPILMFWGFGHPMGVAGAGLATFISVLVGVIALIVFFVTKERYLSIAYEQWRPEWPIWRAMTRIGGPAGAEFVLLSINLMVIYWIIRSFGAAAQAGFGIGGRVMQSLFLPVIAISFAASPLAGQNFGARQADRVRETFRSAAWLTTLFMLILTGLCHIAPEAPIRFFSKEPAVIAFGAEYLRIISWNFVAFGLVYTSASMFQGIGNTLPPLLSSTSRLFVFAVPAYLLSLRPDFHIRHVWYLSVASVTVQAVLNLLLLRREFARKLVFPDVGSTTGMVTASAGAQS
jgi:putative MATE family efflux protein